MKIAATYPEGSFIDLDDDELVAVDCDGARYCVKCAKKAAEAGGLKERGHGPNPIYSLNADDVGDEHCTECGESLSNRVQSYPYI